jgi:hypothetical protein
VQRTAAFGPKTGKWYYARRKSKEDKGVGIRFQRDNIAEPAVAADGAGRTAFRGMTSFQPAPLLNLVFGHMVAHLFYDHLLT